MSAAAFSPPLSSYSFASRALRDTMNSMDQASRVSRLTSQPSVTPYFSSAGATTAVGLVMWAVKWARSAQVEMWTHLQSIRFPQARHRHHSNFATLRVMIWPSRDLDLTLRWVRCDKLRHAPNQRLKAPILFRRWNMTLQALNLTDTITTKLYSKAIYALKFSHSLNLV